MPSGKAHRIVLLGAVVALASGGAYIRWRPASAGPLIGIVRATEIRIAPEVGGQLSTIKVKKGDRVHVGEVVAKLSTIELDAAVGQARAVLAAAVASRDHVYAGVRAEQIAELSAEIAKAKSRLTFAEVQLSRIATLATSDSASQQALDQATKDAAAARADVALAEANYAAAKAGPTREQRAIADAQVKAAAAALTVIERRLKKTVLVAPTDGVVTVVVAEVGENVSAGQPVIAMDESGKQWLSFNVREDFLHGLSIESKVDVDVQGSEDTTPAIVTELLPLGAFATWQAERAVGDYDRNTLRLRVDPVGDRSKFVPGMTVWVKR